jgi:hypothetical protein
MVLPPTTLVSKVQLVPISSSVMASGESSLSSMHSMLVVTLGWGNIGIFMVEVISHMPGSMGMPSAKTGLETRLNNRARHMYFPFILLSFF